MIGVDAWNSQKTVFLTARLKNYCNTPITAVNRQRFG